MEVIKYGENNRNYPIILILYNFADNILKANKHIAYAASMGNMDLSEKNYDIFERKSQQILTHFCKRRKIKIHNGRSWH